jgi:ABC-type Zn uptake system ZnuABC Zn-binding protein ZnuA
MSRKRRTQLITGLLLLGCVLPFAVSGCSSDNEWPDRGGPKVVVTFAPLYCFATNVAGDDAVIKNLMTSAGPHDFQPHDSDARILRKADVLFINGLELDNSNAITLKRGSGNRRLKVVELGDRIPQAQLMEGICHHAEHAGHTHGNDPHVWLSPDMAIIQVNGIRDELKVLDPDHAANYDRRADEYITRLNKLKADGLEMLKDRKDKNIVSFHDSLGYFARTFNLTVVGTVQSKPGVEPTTEEMKKLIQVCKEKNVRLIAVEPQYTSNNAGRAVIEQLKQAGIADPALVEIDPLETVTEKDLTPDWYEKKLRANLEALKAAMK